jgi:putrescine transport system substrate-binding protein
VRTAFASGNLIDSEILSDKSVHPGESTPMKPFVIAARDPATQRLINRLWTRVKTGR